MREKCKDGVSGNLNLWHHIYKTEEKEKVFRVPGDVFNAKILK